MWLVVVVFILCWLCVSSGMLSVFFILWMCVFVDVNVRCVCLVFVVMLLVLVVWRKSWRLVRLKCMMYFKIIVSFSFVLRLG